MSFLWSKLKMEGLRKFFSTSSELNVQLVCLKVAGFFDSMTKFQKVLAATYRVLALITTIFVIFNESVYIFRNHTNIIAITETIAAVVAQVITLVLIPVLWYYSDRIFRMIKEIKELAKKCE